MCSLISSTHMTPAHALLTATCTGTHAITPTTIAYAPHNPQKRAESHTAILHTSRRQCALQCVAVLVKVVRLQFYLFPPFNNGKTCP